MLRLIEPGSRDCGRRWSHGIRINGVNQRVRIGSDHDHPIFAQGVAVEDPATFQMVQEKGAAFLDVQVLRRGRSGATKGIRRDIDSFYLRRPW